MSRVCQVKTRAVIRAGKDKARNRTDAVDPGAGHGYVDDRSGAGRPDVEAPGRSWKSWLLAFGWWLLARASWLMLLRVQRPPNAIPLARIVGSGHLVRQQAAGSPLLWRGMQQSGLRGGCGLDTGVP